MTVTYDAEKSGRGWLDDQRVLDAFEKMLNELLPESDRGATLIAAEMVSAELQKVIQSSAPPFIRSKLKNMFSYPGIAATFSGKTDIAALSGWITEPTYEAVTLLRKLRNKAAHSDSNFQLEEHQDILDKLLDFGPGMKVGINDMALNILSSHMIFELQSKGSKLAEEFGIDNPFENSSKTVERILERPNWYEAIKVRLPRLKLGIATTVIISLCIQRQN